MEELKHESFYKLMRRQNVEWDLIDAGILEEESDSKPIKPIKEKKKAQIELI